jgi:hypothetical protein
LNWPPIFFITDQLTFLFLFGNFGSIGGEILEGIKRVTGVTHRAIKSGVANISVGRFPSEGGGPGWLA